MSFSSKSASNRPAVAARPRNQSSLENGSGPIGIAPKGSKQDCLAAQSAKIEAGHVYLPTDAPWLADFLAEVLAFPNTSHDDQIDTLSQFLQWASSRRYDPLPTTSLPIYGSD